MTHFNIPSYYKLLLMHSHGDIRLLLINSIVFALSLTQIETFLRFTLLILSLTYTIYKLIDRFEEKKKNKKDKL